MRFIATLLFWLLTTAALAIALPAAWAQHTVVDEDGYAAVATSTGKDPALQEAMAAELTAQLVILGAHSGFDTNESLFSGVTRAYTASAPFPGHYALLNRVAHRTLFTSAVGQSDPSGRWMVDLAPLLADSSFHQTLTDFGIQAPSVLEIPATEGAALRPGRLSQVAELGPWVSAGSAIMTGVLAILTLFVARSRGKALGALGVSALLVGAAGWAGIELGRPYVSDALDATSGNIRRMSDLIFEHLVGSAHLWLNLTLLVGAVLVALGVILSLVGGLTKRT